MSRWWVLKIAVACCLLLLASCGASSDTVVADLPEGGQPDAASPQDLRSVDARPADSGAIDVAPVDDVAPADAVVPADATPPALAGCVEGAFNVYFGNLHAHTSHSDGDGTPQEAFQYARDVAKLDIMVVTDHLEQLYLPLPDDRYGKCRSAAAAELQAGVFVAACGFEYGTGFTPLLSATGHANVFFSPTLFPSIQFDFHDFYNTLAACQGCVGQFNHPGSDKDGHFNHFEYHAAVDDRLNLFEFNSDPAWQLYFQALDAGWHLSPVHNQDNHSADWGTADDRRSGLLMSALDLPSMQAALRERRTFMTYDKNASITALADGHCWMGSVLSGPAGLALSVEAVDADSAESFSTVELYGKGQQLLASVDCQAANPCQAAFNVTAAQSPYFVARAVQADGDLLVAAPLWLTP